MREPIRVDLDSATAMPVALGVFFSNCSSRRDEIKHLRTISVGGRANRKRLTILFKHQPFPHIHAPGEHGILKLFSLTNFQSERLSAPRELFIVAVHLVFYTFSIAKEWLDERRTRMRVGPRSFGGKI